MKSGFIALSGRPNVGKSTLLNKIIKEKVAIVSEKPQTTRDRIKGILTTKDSQFVFIDTPGIHKPKHLLGENITKNAISVLKEVDVVAMIIDGTQEIGRGDQFVYDRICESNSKNKVAIINKIDKLDDDEIIDKKQEIKEKLGDFDKIFTVSAEYGINVSELIEQLKFFLVDDVAYYPEEMYTDMPLYKMLTEIVREKIMLNTEQEIPHSVAIEIIDVKKRANSKDCYNMNIYIEKSSQKGIIIGKNGQMLKKIGSDSRKDIERLLEKEIYLNLWVKVKEKWRKKKPFLAEMGYILNEWGETSWNK